MFKRLLVAISTVAVLTTAHADVLSIFVPGPWTVGIGLVRWLAEGQEKILYVEAIGEGVTLDQARQQGFGLAVEHAVGTVIVSETAVRNSRIARDEIITYSSGYVDRFEIVKQQQIGNRIQVNMKIWVKHSKLANRLLNQSETAGTIDGGRISAQIQSLQRERTSGDRLLQSVLADYPRRAFDVELAPTRVFFDANRNGQLEVAFHLSWNKLYIDSIAEAVAAINQRPDCGRFPGCTNVTSEVSVSRRGFGSTTVAYFDDRNAQELIRKEMVQSQPTIRVAIMDANGTEQFKQCFYAKELDYREPAPWYYVTLDYNKVSINGKATKRFSTFINLGTVPAHKLDKVEISLVRGPGC